MDGKEIYENVRKITATPAWPLYISRSRSAKNAASNNSTAWRGAPAHFHLIVLATRMGHHVFQCMSCSLPVWRLVHTVAVPSVSVWTVVRVPLFKVVSETITAVTQFVYDRTRWIVEKDAYCIKATIPKQSLRGKLSRSLKIYSVKRNFKKTSHHSYRTVITTCWQA